MPLCRSRDIRLFTSSIHVNRHNKPSKSARHDKQEENLGNTNTATNGYYYGIRALLLHLRFLPGSYWQQTQIHDAHYVYEHKAIATFAASAYYLDKTKCARKYERCPRHQGAAFGVHTTLAHTTIVSCIFEGCMYNNCTQQQLWLPAPKTTPQRGGATAVHS